MSVWHRNSRLLGLALSISYQMRLPETALGLQGDIADSHENSIDQARTWLSFCCMDLGYISFQLSPLFKLPAYLLQGVTSTKITSSVKWTDIQVLESISSLHPFVGTLTIALTPILKSFKLPVSGSKAIFSPFYKTDTTVPKMMRGELSNSRTIPNQIQSLEKIWIYCKYPIKSWIRGSIVTAQPSIRSTNLIRSPRTETEWRYHIILFECMLTAASKFKWYFANYERYINGYSLHGLKQGTSSIHPVRIYFIEIAVDAGVKLLDCALQSINYQMTLKYSIVSCPCPIITLAAAQTIWIF